MSDKPYSLECAKLDWDEQAQPISPQFDDIYFSKENGLAETEYVFLEGNKLKARWNQLEQDVFTIAETGFGTGLNFLAAWSLWNKCNTGSSELHFLSVEKFPLKPQDLEQALSLWPELKELAELLLANYPPQPWQGLQNIELHSTSKHIKPVRLLLYFGSAEHAWRQISPQLKSDAISALKPAFGETAPKVDAWFLDGFAPSKNPEMWTEYLFKGIKENSTKTSTLATFTCAGIVKRGLKNNGFNIKKIAGFGKKREMLIASFDANNDHKNETKTQHKHLRPRLGSSNLPNWLLNDNSKARLNSSKTALVIGAGLAGSHVARKLAERGFQVTVLERKSIASQASGNPAGAVFTRLGLGNDMLSEFNLSAQIYADQFYQQHGYYQRCGDQSGVLHLSSDKNTQARFEKLLAYYSGKQLHILSKQQSSEALGIDIQCGGLWLPDSGWLNPVELCKELLQHPNINIYEQHSVSKLSSEDGLWFAHCQTPTQDKAALTTFQASHCIVATAYEASQLEQCAQLPLKRIRGQVTYLDSNNTLKKLKAVVCGEGYLTPAQHNQDGDFHCAGATFNLNDDGLDLREEDQNKNIDALSRFITAYEHDDKQALKGRVAFRTSSPDYLPLVGPLVNEQETLKRFSALRHKANADIGQCAVSYPGLYCALGFGSRGLAYTPIAAQLISDLICGTYLPVRRDLYANLHPVRFKIRQLSKGEL